MDAESYYKYMDQLRFSQTADERKEALNILKILEAEGAVESRELLQLLKDEDPVIKTYAIGAVARQKIIEAGPVLQKMFEQSMDPLILRTLLDAFIEYNHSAFVKVTIRKIKRLNSFFFRLLHARRKNVMFDDAFVLDQILVPTLKYFELCGYPKMKSFLKRFLKSKDPNVRWHTLKVFQKLDIQIPVAKLQQIEDNDSYAPNRELAGMMLMSEK